MTPDISEATRFLSLLDPSAERFTFQTFDDSDEKRPLAQIFNGTLLEHADTLAALNNQGAGVFVTINETNFKGRKKENIDRVRAIFEDYDCADAVQRAEYDTRLLDPHIVVESSPGKRHVYRLVNNVPLDRFTPWQAHMSALLGSDPIPKDLPRVMRLPGFFHRKGEPFIVRVLAASDHPRYSEDELAVIFGEPSITDKPKPEQASNREVMSSGGVIPVGARNSTLFSLAGTMHRAGMSPEAIEAALLVENQRCEVPLSEVEVKDDIAKRISTQYEGGSLPYSSHARNAPFSFVPCSDLLAGPKAARWLIRGWIEAASLNMLFGDSSTGKSFVALDWCLCIATGRVWNGCTVRQGAVFYIAGEGKAGLGRRMAAWGIHHGADLADAPFFVSERAAALMNEVEAENIAQSVRDLAEMHGNPALVVVDTLHRNMGDGDENSPKDFGIFLDNIDKLIRGPLGCAVLIVHHSGHVEKSRSRGSSSIRAAMDGEFCLQFEGAHEQGIRKLSTTKMKDSEPPEPLTFGAEVITLPPPWIDEETITPLTSLVLTRTTAKPLPRTKELARQAKIALEVLQVLLQDAVAPAGGTAAVPENTWRKECYSAGVSDGGNEAKRAAFRRARDTLKKASMVSCRDGVCWTCDVLPIGNSLQVT